MIAACPDEATLASFCTGRLEGEAAAAVASHLDGCQSCLRRAAQVARTTCEAVGLEHIGHIVNDVPRRIEEYHLVRRIGQGAMGQVFEAIDLHLDRPVAIKLLAIERHEAAMARFLVEARAVARLSHPNVVTIHRVGEIGRHPYLVYELVRGASLDQVPRPMPWRRVKEVALALARGLAAAHRAGVLHRDIKPANVMLCEDGGVKLLDFGLAKLGDQGDADGEPDAAALVARSGPDVSPLVARSPVLSLTATGATMGTPLYMAPEAWRGERPTARADLYSLGAVLWELCAGAPLHAGVTLEDVKRAAAGPPRPLAPEVPGIDARFAEVIDRCVAVAPEERFGSAEALIGALEAVDAVPVAAAPEAPVATVAGPAAPPRRRLVVPVALAALATLVALAVVALRPHAPAPAVPPPAPAAPSARAAAPHPDETCSPDHWCWQNGVAMQMQHVWARARDDAWGLGERGTVEHWDGTRWSTVEAPTIEDLESMHGVAADDAWLVGWSGTVLHWDGQRFRQVATPVRVRLTAVRALARDDAWAVGVDGTAIHWDGRRWSLSPTGVVTTLNLLAARGPRDVWAAGEEGVLVHWDGAAWARVPTGTTARFSGLQLVGDEVWVCGHKGFMGRLRHGAWEQLDLPDIPAKDRPDVMFNGLWAGGPDDVWLLTKQVPFLHWDGKTWTRSDPGTHFEMYAIDGTAPDDIWVVSNPHIILHWDGHAWALQEPLRAYEENQAVWAAAADDVWIAGWTSVDGWWPPRHAHVQHYDGDAWRVVTGEGIAGAGALYAVWGARADDVWFMGDAGATFHWDGRALRHVEAPVPEGQSIRALRGTRADDVWAVGTKGTALHWDGVAWRAVASGTDADLRALWGSARDDVWAVGTKGTILRWDGAAWRAAASGTDASLYAVWGASARDVWAAGERGLTLRWEGAAWTSYASGTPEHVLVLSGTAADDVWAGTYIFLGDVGTLSHWNGRFWASMAHTPNMIVRGLWAVDRDDVWAVGPWDLKLHYRPFAP